VTWRATSSYWPYSEVGYDNDREMHTLELLKLRFGEASLHKCEVMLKAGGLLRTALVLFR